jgi:uncharacterized membrane protein YhdT
MQNRYKQALRELIWLLGLVAFTILLTVLFFGKAFLNGELDIHLHDTYFILPTWLMVIPLFLLLAFGTYFIREKRKSFGRHLNNWLLTLVGITLIVVLTYLTQSVSPFVVNGFTIYPPLSALSTADTISNSNISAFTQSPAVKFVIGFLMFIQSTVLILFSYFIFRWGTNRSAKN